MTIRITARLRAALATSLFAILVAGCASTDMERGRRYVDESQVERPPVVLVYDFAVTDAEVVVDEAGLGSSDEDGEEGAALAEEQRKFAEEVADVMAATMVAELNEREIAARRAEPSEVPPLHALLLKGAFQTIDEGDQLSRVTVGFGAGKSEVEIEMTLFQQMTYGAKLLSSDPQHFAYLKISEGCDRTCTFCAIPKMRGKHITKPIEMVNTAPARRTVCPEIVRCHTWTVARPRV